MDPQELHHELRPKPIERYRAEAKSLLRAVRAGEPDAVDRAGATLGARLHDRFVLADALRVIALEHGHRSWPAFKRAIEAASTSGVRVVGRIGASPSSVYAASAEQLLAAAREGAPDAVARLRAGVPRLADDEAVAERATLDDSRVCLAREYGFRTWAELADASDRAHDEHYSRLPAKTGWKRAEAAIRAGDAAALAQLLDAHPGLEHQDPGMTLLCAAAQPEAGDVPREVVDLLIEAGSELDVPLNLAACFNKAAMVGWLLDAGADAAAVPIWGITPLQTAAYHGSRGAADVLVARTGLLPDAFDLAAVADDLDRLAAWFDSAGRLRPEAAQSVRTSPMSAGRRNLLRPTTPPTCWRRRSRWPPTPRTRACDVLLERGADVARASLYGLTPLHFAASQGCLDTARLLVARGAPLDARDGLHGGTPLSWAQHNGHQDPALLHLLEPVG